MHAAQQQSEAAAALQQRITTQQVSAAHTSSSCTSPLEWHGTSTCPARICMHGLRGLT
jgi:hypothetical protein